MNPDRLLQARPELAADVLIAESEGTISVRDLRLFRTDRRAFCTRLVEHAAVEPQIRRVELDLDAATVRVHFGAPADSRAMALVFAEAVRKASTNVVSRAPVRRQHDWSTLTAFHSDGHLSIWETREVKPGRWRVRHRGRAGDRARARRLAEGVAGVEGVKRCRHSPLSDALIVDVRPGSLSADQLVDRLEQALENQRERALGRAGSAVRPLEAASNAPVRAVSILRRVRYLVLAGGSFALTLVALVIPGMPTVPFLIATSYYLARSSPKLDAMLRHTIFFGPILEEWEHHRGLSRTSKGKLIALSFIVLVISVIVTSPTPLTWVLIIALFAVSVYEINRMPSSAGATDADRLSGLHAPLALPAH